MIRVCVIPGSGIGREVIPAAIEVLEATGLPLDFVYAKAGWDCFERSGTSLPDATLAKVRGADAVPFSAASTANGPGACARWRRGPAAYARPIWTARREPKKSRAQ